MKRIITMLLVLSLTFGLFPAEASAYVAPLIDKIDSGKPEISVNTQSRTSGFSKDYTLTGDGAADMVAIALAQVGRTGSEIGYTEDWCANFVSDCAILASQTDAVPQYGLVSGLYSRVIAAGGTVTTGNPKPGDLCFINWNGGSSMGHVEIVYAVSGTKVYTVGGNSGSGTLYTRCVKKHAPLSSNYIVSIVRPNYAVNTYSVSYNANGGSGAPDDQTKIHDTALTLSTTKPTRTGYTFQGWATSASATSAAYQPGGSFTTNANTTLYAVWKANTYTVAFNANGGSGAPAKQTKTYGTALTLSSAKPTRDGYTFQGWATSASATSAAYQPGGSFTTNANTTLYAVWKANTYTVSFDPNGGSGVPDSQTKTHDTTLTLSSATPARTGYAFLGWNTSSSAATAAYQPGSSFTVNADTTLYAVWSLDCLAAGTCGDDLVWTLDDTGIFTVSGSGDMKDFTYKSEMPWYEYADRITTVVISDGVTSIGNFAFYGMPNLAQIQIPDSVTAIGSYAFKGSQKLNHVTLPSKLTQLGESAFYGCSSLTSIEIPASLWTVKPYTFKNCTALEEVIFHEGNLEKISDSAFYGTALTEVTLPDCLTILDTYAFKNCSALESVTLGSGLTELREAVFYGTAIPAITIPEGITKIGPYAFKSCTNLVSVDLPGTLTTVDMAAFYGCTALASIELPDAVTTIGSYAFRKCTGLTSVTFGSGLTKIGESSFYGCTGLTTLDIPANVTTIQAYAFKGCKGVTTVSLPDSLVTIGDSALHSCTGLKAIVIPASVETIGAYCFSGSWNLWQITFQGDAPSIGTEAFNDLEANAYYPGNNATWTADAQQNYGGSITWKAV